MVTAMVGKHHGLKPAAFRYSGSRGQHYAVAERHHGRAHIVVGKDTLIVLSGGMDSVTLLYDHAPDIALAVNFIYGSNHNMRELECARLHCGKLGIELLEILWKSIKQLLYK